MRSSELARLAGVSVRALRHYHQVGVLPEPERATNGYRTYSVHDLIRVLRIKRLSAVGIALDDMRAILDRPPGAPAEAQANTNELLEQLDKELVAEIGRLQKQRALIYRLRSHQSAPDVPPEIAPFLTAFLADDIPAWYDEFERDQSVLFAHVAGDAGVTLLAQVYEYLSDEQFVPEITEVNKKFSQLSDHSSAQDVADLVEQFLALLQRIAVEDVADQVPAEVVEAAELLMQHSDDVFNEPQRQVVRFVEARLNEISRD